MPRDYNDEENMDPQRFYMRYKNGSICCVDQYDPSDDYDEKRKKKYESDYYEEDDYRERRKKKHCDHDHGCSCGRCCPPWADWWKCLPPPWFWMKPEKDERKDEKEKDDNKHKEDDKKRREGGELEAYAYVYQFAATQVSVPAGSDVIFTNNGPLRCVTHTPNTTNVLIRKSGIYQIFYAVDAVSTSGPANIALAVNDAVDPSTTVIVGLTPGLAAGKVLLQLRAGDYVTLRNSSISGASILLAGAPSVGAQLTLERIDDFDCDKGCEKVFGGIDA